MNKKENSEIRPTIRPMKKNDVNTLILLESGIFPDPWPAEAFIEGLTDKYHKFIVAEVDGKIAGYASYFIDLGEGRLTNMAVAPDFRRKNIAKKLLECILELVEKAGCKYIFLDVRPTNEAAISLYCKYGFYEVYRRPGYYRTPVEDAIVMVRSLSDK